MSARAAEPTKELRDRVEAVVGQRWVRWQVPDCGLSPAHRFLATFEDGSSAFVKAAVDAPTRGWLETERRVLGACTCALMPEIRAWIADDARPILLTEDLSEAHWPASHAGVAWREGDQAIVFGGLEALGEIRAPQGLPPLSRAHPPRWPELAARPERFLALSLCTAQWLEAAAPALCEAEETAPLDGDRLFHGDVRSDNLCIRDGRLVLVDWSSAARGVGRLNLASLLSSFHLEGGPRPADVMPDAGAWAAVESGLLATRAASGDSVPPWLLAVFTRLAAIGLAWAAACLELPAPDGRSWREI